MIVLLSHLYVLLLRVFLPRSLAFTNATLPVFTYVPWDTSFVFLMVIGRLLICPTYVEVEVIGVLRVLKFCRRSVRSFIVHCLTCVPVVSVVHGA